MIVNNRVVPAVNQIETYSFCPHTAAAQIPQENGVQIESRGPFAEGRNSLFGTPTLSALAA